MKGEISSGFKQTEIGSIPKDWGNPKFLELYAEPSRNGVYKTSAYHGRGAPIVNMGEMFGFEFISGQEMSRVELNSRELALSGLKNGDLLFGRRSVVPSGAGKCSLVLQCPEPTTFESSIIRVRLDKSISDPLFFYYFFASPAGRSLMAGIISGTNVKGIRATELKKLNIYHPPLLEQRVIAAALADADALIAALQGMIAKKRDLRQAAVQQLLTSKTRLPGFSGEWELKRLGELLKYEQPTKYLVSSTDYSDDFDIPVLTAGKTFVLGRTNEKTGIFTELPAIIFDDFTTASKLVDFPFKAKSSAMKILKPRSRDANIGVVFELMQMVDFMMSDHKRYWISEFQKIEVRIPNPVEQAAIAAVLSDMDADLAALEAQAAKARAFKQGMMQELLTGRVRLI